MVKIEVMKMTELLKNTIINLIGTYNAPTYDQIIDGETVSVIPAGMAGVDWTWVASALMLIVVVYCVMRFIGVLIKNA